MNHYHRLCQEASAAFTDGLAAGHSTNHFHRYLPRETEKKTEEYGLSTVEECRKKSDGIFREIITILSQSTIITVHETKTDVLTIHLSPNF